MASARSSVKSTVDSVRITSVHHGQGEGASPRRLPRRSPDRSLRAHTPSVAEGGQVEDALMMPASLVRSAAAVTLAGVLSFCPAACADT